jgi:hypothetical protein
MSLDTLREELKAEYKILQKEYEAFDDRALKIKSWSAPLLAAGIGLGDKLDSFALIIAFIVAAVCLWILEIYWRVFQRSYSDRIRLIEAWFRDNSSDKLAPFQIMAAWGKRFHEQTPSDIVKIACWPSVWLPYLPMCLLGFGAILIKASSYLPR